jgi:hypothetical protein
VSKISLYSREAGVRNVPVPVGEYPGFWLPWICDILHDIRPGREKLPSSLQQCIDVGLLGRIEKTEFVRAAVEEEADLTELRQPPTTRTWFGISLMGFSYIIGWPAIALLGFVSIGIQEPWLVAVGGPLLYGLSHLVFLLGMVLAGTQYTLPFLRWAARRAVEKWGRDGPRKTASSSVSEKS